MDHSDPSNDGGTIANSTDQKSGPSNGEKKPKSVRILETERRYSSSKPLSMSSITSSIASSERSQSHAQSSFWSLSPRDLDPVKLKGSNRTDDDLGVPKPRRRIQRRMSQVNLPRLIDRDFPFHQSSSRVQVQNENTKPLFRLLVMDWFHVILRLPWYYSFPGIIGIWYLFIWIFAWAFVVVDGANVNREKDCGLGDPNEPIHLSAAYAFSLETCTTVGCEFRIALCMYSAAMHRTV